MATLSAMHKGVMTQAASSALTVGRMILARAKSCSRWVVSSPRK